MAKAVKTVCMTLKNLKVVTEVTIVMSDDLANSLDSLFNTKVPGMWLKGNWFSTTVGVWFGIMLAPYDQCDQWLNQDQPKSC